MANSVNSIGNRPGIASNFTQNLPYESSLAISQSEIMAGFDENHLYFAQDENGTGVKAFGKKYPALVIKLNCWFNLYQTLTHNRYR